MRQALEGADIVPLTMSLIQLTGDLTLLAAVRPYVRGPWDYSHSVPDDLAAAIRSRLDVELDRLATGGIPALAAPAPEQIRAMMSAAVGEEVPAEYVPMLLQQMGLASGALAEPEALPESEAPVDAGRFRVVIVGPASRASPRRSGCGKPAFLRRHREESRGRRHLVREPLPGLRRRHTQPLLSVLVRTEQRLAAVLFPPGEHLGLPESLHRQVPHPRRDPLRVRGRLGPFRRGVAPVAGDLPRRGRTGDCRGRKRPNLRGRPAQPAGHPGHPRAPGFQGRDLPHGDLDRGHRPRGQARRAGRDGGERRPDRSADRRRGRVAAHPPALGAWIVRSPNIHREVSPDKTWALDAIPSTPPGTGSSCSGASPTACSRLCGSTRLGRERPARSARSTSGTGRACSATSSASLRAARISWPKPFPATRRSGSACSPIRLVLHAAPGQRLA